MALVATNGGVNITGAFAGRLDFVGSPTNDLISTPGDDDFDEDNHRDDSYDVFVARYDTAGGLQSAVKFGGNGDDWGNAIAQPVASTNVPIGGIFRNTASFNLTNPGASPKVKSAGLQDAFFLSLNLVDDLT